MKCPNCGASVVRGHPAHQTGCILGDLLGVLLARGHDLSRIESLDVVDPDQLWERYGGPSADWLASELGLPPYPDDPEVSPASMIRGGGS